MGRPLGGTKVRVFTVPTETPESDGTLAWQSTTLIVVEVASGDRRGLGYTYGSPSLGPLIDGTLAPLLVGQDALSPSRASAMLWREVRNLGASGAVAMAISAVDVALWDLKARLLDLPLANLLGRRRDRVPAYWSGGFTSSGPAALRREFARARRDGFTRFKMKVGRAPAEDAARVAEARATIGRAGELYVDANGAYTVPDALGWAARFARSGVTWLEEPVPQADVSGLARVRASLPPGMALAAGEYGSTLRDFARLLDDGAVDVLQADATRCGGVTGFLGAAVLAQTAGRPLSSHTAPSLHVHLDAAVGEPFHSLEYFLDHVRVESELFRGAARAERGHLVPDGRHPGLGLALREAAAARYEVNP
jgi:L-alanine-DL-glutamate epimerase-like enolase superfamily enzyme